MSTFWKMFLCSLRYCLKCYFSKGVYSFTLSTVCFIYIYTVYIFNTKTNLVKYLIIRIFLKTFCLSHHCKIRLLLAAFHISKGESNVHHCASSHITLQPKTGCPLKLSRVELVSTWMGDLLGKTRLLLDEVLVRPAGGVQSVWVLTRDRPIYRFTYIFPDI